MIAAKKYDVRVLVTPIFLTTAVEMKSVEAKSSH